MALDSDDQPAYQPFPNFTDWSAATATSDALSTALTEFRTVQSQVDEAAFARIGTLLRREAAAETGAVEELYDLPPGATRSIAAMEPGWEAILGDQRSEETFQDQLDTYRFVQDQAATSGPVTESLIRELHKVVCASQVYYTGFVQDSLSRLVPSKLRLARGGYKTGDNHVLTRSGKVFMYASVLDVRPEMERLAVELSSESFLAAHPILKAAYAHYCFVRIHPFSDGNGRVARALASYYCYQYCGLPLIVYSDRKLTYRQALEAADRGAFQDFVDYVIGLVIDILGRAKQELLSVQRPAWEMYAFEVDSLISELTGPTIEDISKVGERFSDLVSDKFTQRGTAIAELDPEGLYDLDVGQASSYDENVPVEFRSAKGLWVNVSLKKGAEVRASKRVAIGITRTLPATFAFCLTREYDRPYVSDPDQRESDWQPPGAEVVRLRYDDVYGGLSTGASAKVDLFIDATLALIWKDLRDQLTVVLKQAGYDHP